MDIVNKDFENWWNENEKQLMADSCHMSEFHIASVVWDAAIRHERSAEQSTKPAQKENDQ